MSPLKLSRTTSGTSQEETVVLDDNDTLTKKVEKVLKTGVPLEQAFREGMEEVVRKHGQP
jgi:hypothetical protein